MKNFKLPLHKDDQGMAIIFSLIMLTIFFILSFGFISLATSAKQAASARIPSQSADLSTYEYVFNEALLGLDQLGEDSGGDVAPVLDWSRLDEYDFTSGADTATFFGFATSRRASGDSVLQDDSLSTYLTLQLKTTNDYTINTATSPTWSNTGWISDMDLDGDGNNDKYAWIILESNGLDINYIGGANNTAGTLDSQTAYRRTGRLIKELDFTYFDTANYRNLGTEDLYVDWTATTPAPWESKNQLVDSLTSYYETMVQSFYVGTTPIEIMEHNTSDGFYDLGLIDDSFAYTAVKGGISWLNASGTAEATQIAANIKELCDKDNEASEESGVVGNERVPYINEIVIGIENNTTAGASMAPSNNTFDLDIWFEFAKIYEDSNYPTWAGSVVGTSGANPTGVSATCTIEGSITFTRTGDAAGAQTYTLNEAFTLDISSTVNGYFLKKGVLTNLTQGSSESADTQLTDVSVTITSIKLEGVAGTLWDKSNLSITSNTTDITSTISSGIMTYVGANVEDPRVNTDTANWSFMAETSSKMDFDEDITVVASMNGTTEGHTTATSFDNESFTDNYSSWSDTETASQIWNMSTAYMPPIGIEFLSQLGFISRGVAGQTLNLTDYNMDSPTTFALANHIPTGNLDLSDSTTFNGGDRALLDSVMLSSAVVYSAKISDWRTGAYVSYDYSNKDDTAQYKQFGAINPNTSDSNTIKILLYGSSTHYGPYRADTAHITNATLDSLVLRFPSFESSPTQAKSFQVDDFHDSTNNYHNRNPKTYGYIFSTKHPNQASNDITLTDAQREAMVMNTMKLVSPKYSYYTIIGAVHLLDATPAIITTKKLYSFIRRDNESGAIKTIKQTTN